MTARTAKVSLISGRFSTAVMRCSGRRARWCRKLAVDVAFGLVELRLVGDVADHARLGARAEKRALRTLQHLDALQVGRVDVEVAAGELA